VNIHGRDNGTGSLVWRVHKGTLTLLSLRSEGLGCVGPHIYRAQWVFGVSLQFSSGSVTLRRTNQGSSPLIFTAIAKPHFHSMVMDAPNPSSSGASSFLANLPSRGHFSSTIVSSNPVLQFPFSPSHSFSRFQISDLPTFTAIISIPMLPERSRCFCRSAGETKGFVI